MDGAIAALDGGFAVESPSGACSSVQKLKSWFLRRMFASCRSKGALVHNRALPRKLKLSALSEQIRRMGDGARNRVEETPRFRREFATV
jgi:hypothetical protein